MTTSKPGIVSDTKKSAKAIAQQIARQVAQEPTEILKTAGRQVIGTPEVAKYPETQQPASETSPSPDLKAHAEKTKHKDTRLLQALEQEITEIRMKNKQEEDQVRMAEEQQRQQVATSQQKDVLPVISSKRSRRFGMGKGQKAAAEREQVKTEKPVPPSG